MKNIYNLDYHANQWYILTNQWPYVGAVYYDHNGWKWEIVAKNDSFIKWTIKVTKKIIIKI